VTHRSTGARFERVFLRCALIAVAVLALTAAAWLLSEVILLVFGSVLLAVTLRSLAAPLSRHLALGERWALALAGLLLLGLLATAVLLFGAEVAQQMRGLSERLSAAAQGLVDHLELGSLGDMLKGNNPAASLASIVTRLFAWSSTLLGVLAGLLLVVFGGIYLAIDPGLYRAGLIKLVPPAAQPSIETTLDDIGEALRRWLAAQLLAMVLVGTLTGLGLWLVGVPSAFALGLITGVAEFVPIVGPVAAAVPIILVASAQDWQSVLWAIGIVVLVQQLESNLITPLVVGRSVSIAPAVALFAVVSMGVLFGPLGLLFGFPLALVLDVAVRRLYVLDTLGERVEIMGRPATKAASTPGR
jgi:predicted PurR-regulated permease PerM